MRTIDEGIRLLTGREAGERGGDGRYPEDGVNRLVEDRLAAFAKARQAFGRDADGRDVSMANEPRLHRVILHLRHGAAERAIIRAAAELAQMLGVALHGVFLEDEALPELAALPFIREFRLGTGSWQRLDRQRLAEEQREAAGRGATAAG